MKKITFIFTLLCASVMGWSYDIAPSTTFGGHYQWQEIDGVTPPANVVNVQPHGGFDCLYITFADAGFNRDNIVGGEVFTDAGAQAWLKLASYTDASTDVYFYKTGSTTEIRWGLRILNTEAGSGSSFDPASIDWNNVDFISGQSQYKIYFTEENRPSNWETINIQTAPWAGNNTGIYVTTPDGVSACSLGDKVGCWIEGAQVLMYLTAFVDEVTEVTITHASGTKTLYVYNANAGSGSSTPDPAPTKASECIGTKGHFGTPTVKNVYYQIEYADNKAVISLRSLTGHDLDYAEVQIMSVVSSAMTADGNGGYTYTINNPTVNAEWYIRFLYSDTNMPGNEMTAQDLSTTDANIIYYKVGECMYTTIEDSNMALSSLGTSATGTDAENNTPDKALDGNNSTRWSSVWDVDPQDFVLDLGQRRKFNAIQFVWYTTYSRTFDLLISDNGTDWTKIKSVDRELQNADYKEESFDLGFNYTAQYIKFHGITRGAGYGHSFREIRVLYSTTPVLTTYSASLPSRFATIGSDYQIQIVAKDQLGNDFPVSSTYSIEPAAAGTITTEGVYTPAQTGTATITAQGGGKSSSFEVRNEISANLALNKTATAGQNNSEAYKSNNESLTDRWNSGGEGAVHYAGGANPDFKDWWYVDLGKQYDIAEIAVKWEGACPNDYDIRISPTAEAESWVNLQTYDSYPSATQNDGNASYTNNYEYYHNFANPQPGRYVGFWARNGFADLAYGISMYDVQVFGQEHVDAGIDVTGITMSQNAATIEMSEPLTLTAEVSPFNATDKEIVWTSTDESVATVVGGVITTVAPGTTTIRATAHDGSGEYDECALTVEAIAAKTCWGVADDFSFQDNTVSYNYSVTRNSDKTLTFYCEFSRDITGLGNLNIVTPTDHWHLMTYNAGTKTATCTTEDPEIYEKGDEIHCFFYFEGRRFDFDYTVASVCAKSTVDVTSVEINHDALTLTIGENSTVTASVVPANADDKEIIWTNSNPSVASFNEATGEVTALENGTTTITAKSHFDESIFATCVVKVVDAIEPTVFWNNGIDTENDVAIAYSITRNTDRTLTYAIEALQNKSDFGVQVNDGDYHTAALNEGIYTWTSTATYTDGALLNGFIYMPFSGGAARVDFSYTVGSETARKYIPITLKDDDNNFVISASNNAIREVKLSRTFPNTDEWYTLCLPFDLSDEQLTEVFGAGYTLAELIDSEDRGSLIHLNFDYAPAFTAGKAYLLRPGTGVTSAPTFNGVTVKNVTPIVSGDDLMHFQGTFNLITLDQDNQRFVGPENYLYSPAANGTNMKAFRCFFTIPEGSQQSNVMGKRARIVFGPQETTDIDLIDQEPNTTGKLLINGQLYIIRDGKTYNAQGMLVK